MPAPMGPETYQAGFAHFLWTYCCCQVTAQCRPNDSNAVARNIVSLAMSASADAPSLGFGPCSAVLYWEWV